MRLRIPLTGTVAREGQVHGDGLLSGDPNDPIKPINLPLGKHISWTMIDVDMEDEVMIIEVEPGDTVDEPTGQVDASGMPVLQSRPATAVEKLSFLHRAKAAVEDYTKDELYEMSDSPRLKRPFKK